MLRTINSKILDFNNKSIFLNICILFYKIPNLKENFFSFNFVFIIYYFYILIYFFFFTVLLSFGLYFSFYLSALT